MEVIRKFIKQNWIGFSALALGASSLFYLGNQRYHDMNNPHVTNFIDVNSDSIPDIAIDSYYKLPPRVDENGFTHYELGDRIRKRKPTEHELDIFKEIRERDSHYHNQPIKNIYNIV